MNSESRKTVNCYFHCVYSVLVIPNLDVLACTGVEKFRILEADLQRCQHSGVKNCIKHLVC